ncbi:MAG: M23 family metallopeptidase [Candidatus Chisholmbacteria bacterium]|nr:M23 family metallopeptidase [Candidatus Chisholmbacteria bacterium]
MAESYGAFVPKTRTSHPLSKMLWPALQHKRWRTLLGANLAGMMIVATSVSAAPNVLETYPEAEVPVVTEQVVLTTEQRFVAPVETIGVSQGFSRFHRGVDMRSAYGSEVKAIASGRVVETVYSRFGYGHYVLVEHEGGFASLYAHLNQIFVKPGGEVAQGTALGTVGTTGWSTGSHLHMEIYEKGAAVDPRQILSV